MCSTIMSVAVVVAVSVREALRAGYGDVIERPPLGQQRPSRRARAAGSDGTEAGPQSRSASSLLPGTAGGREPADLSVAGQRGSLEL
ncbi:unnamed protein product [Lampetra fluviatilis]